MSHDIDEKGHNGQFRLQTRELQIIARDWLVGFFQNHGVHLIEMMADGTRGSNLCSHVGFVSCQVMSIRLYESILTRYIY